MVFCIKIRWKTALCKEGPVRRQLEHGSRLGYLPWLISCGLFRLSPGARGDAPTIPKTTKRSYHHFAILKDQQHSNEYIIILTMSKIQFLLRIHKKDLFLLPNATEVALNTIKFSRFYYLSSPSQPN